MMLKFLSCLLLSSLTITTCFLFGYLVIWVYEKLSGGRASLDVLIAYIILIVIITIVLMGC